MRPRPFVERTEVEPREFLESVGEVFAVFDETTQDSGNVSYGIRIAGERLFVKTAGRAEAATVLARVERIALLRNAARLARSIEHPALPALRSVVESPTGPMLVYEWVDGELLHAPAEVRDDPGSALRRFREIPAEEALRALDTLLDVHAELARRGWIAVDLYDGSMIYDFDRRALHLVDLDHYHEGPFTNSVGRMFGSSRFMAPEEFVRGETIDERTTVFTLGRCAAVLLSDGSVDRAPFRGSGSVHAVVARACRPAAPERWPSVGSLLEAWRAARGIGGER